MTIKVIATDMDGTFLDDKGSYDKERFRQILDAMAFGDGDNDLELLQMAGRSYAMENASPAILQVADQIAPHHKDQGVLTVLEDYLGLV